MVNGTRTCSKCGVRRPLTEFYRDNRGRGGFRADCKVCCRAKVRSSYDPAKKRAYNQAYYQQNAESLKAASVRRYYANYERERSRWLARNEANAKDYKPASCAWCGKTFKPRRSDSVTCGPECYRKYYPTTPEGRAKKAAQQRRIKANRRSVPHVAYSDTDIYERDSWRCQLCGGQIATDQSWPHPLSPSIDHIIPLADGGWDAPHNVQAAHLRCNQSKGDRLCGSQLRLIG